jgi:hypothetical protein
LGHFAGATFFAKVKNGFLFSIFRLGQKSQKFDWEGVTFYLALPRKEKKNKSPQWTCDQWQLGGGIWDDSCS